VIGELSKNFNDSRCFKCQDYDHIVAQCPSRCLLVRGTDSDDEGLEAVVYEAVGSESNTDKDVRVSSVQLCVVRCSHTTVRDED